MGESNGSFGVRDLLLSDLVELENNSQFPIESLSNKPKIIKIALEDDEGLIGAAIVTGTVEV